VTLWPIWTARNDLVFNQKQWNSDNVKAAIWGGFIEYGKIAWGKVCSGKRKNQSSYSKASDQFDSNWSKHESMCKRDGMKVQWVSLLNFMGGGGVASGPCPVLPGCRHWLPVVFSFLFAIGQCPVCAKKKKKKLSGDVVPQTCSRSDHDSFTDFVCLA
jgi:hypothetical protein